MSNLPNFKLVIPCEEFGRKSDWQECSGVAVKPNPPKRCEGNPEDRPKMYRNILQDPGWKLNTGRARIRSCTKRRWVFCVSHGEQVNSLFASTFRVWNTGRLKTVTHSRVQWNDSFAGDESWTGGFINALLGSLRRVECALWRVDNQRPYHQCGGTGQTQRSRQTDQQNRHSQVFRQGKWLLCFADCQRVSNKTRFTFSAWN